MLVQPALIKTSFFFFFAPLWWNCTHEGPNTRQVEYEPFVGGKKKTTKKKNSSQVRSHLSSEFLFRSCARRSWEKTLRKSVNRIRACLYREVGPVRQAKVFLWERLSQLATLPYLDLARKAGGLARRGNWVSHVNSSQLFVTKYKKSWLGLGRSWKAGDPSARDNFTSYSQTCSKWTTFWIQLSQLKRCPVTG